MVLEGSERSLRPLVRRFGDGWLGALGGCERNLKGGKVDHGKSDEVVKERELYYDRIFARGENFPG